MVDNLPGESSLFTGWLPLTLKNSFASLTVIPQLGGKIVSLQSTTAAGDFLWQDATRPYRQPVYGDAFGNYDASGFDECFPTIGECAHPDFPWQDVIVPDHGELWCIPWQHEVTAAGVYLHTYGVRFPYHFEKWISLAPNAGRFTIRYRVTNLSSFAFNYLWSAHPLFAAHEGMQVVIPGSPTMRFTFAVGSRVTGDYLQTFQWPWITAPDGTWVDYSRIGSSKLAANDKVYVESPPAGWCALYNPHTRHFVALSFAPDKIPYIGVCIDHCGWPFEGRAGYWVALEPCTSYPDGLNEAVAQHVHATLPPLGMAEWSLVLHIGQADSAEAIEHMITSA